MSLNYSKMSMNHNHKIQIYFHIYKPLHNIFEKFTSRLKEPVTFFFEPVIYHLKLISIMLS